MTLLPSLAVLAAIVLGFCPATVTAQNVVSDVGSARALDALLQGYAYHAFIRPKTGIPYDGIVPGNLTGVNISAIRLRSGSFRARGVPRYKEFEIPTRIIVRPYVVRLVLVYQNLGNWSSVYYPLPGYTYVAPVIGLLAYDASNLSATGLPELDIEASGSLIAINFSSFIPVLTLGTPPPKCIRFDLNGSVNLSSLISDNTCLTTQQGHFSVVIESTAPSPGMAVLPPPPNSRSQKSSERAGKIAGLVIGGSAVLVVVGVLALWVTKRERRHHIQKMERAADAGEGLRLASVGDTRAPSAMVTRTQPLLEHEYIP